ncbi:unnamed protein product [Orchesella dallaii]|uniref:Peptidase S8/S53 domain-containing protein n=1 Tax=Orchesella dallaii TaxID=48710 RepID=A0ABP1QWA1_9HEXA
MLKFLAFLLTLQAASAAPGSPSQSIITPELQAKFEESETANIFIYMTETTSQVLETVASSPFPDRATKLNALHDALQSHASQTQGQILGFLSSENKDFTSFWINNQIFVKNADLALVTSIAEQFSGIISSIDLEFFAHLIIPMDIKTNLTLEDELQWGVAKIEADKAWEHIGGIQRAGEGVVIATVDTGVRGTHEALRDNFAGDYGWFDPSTGDLTPTDNNGHGTHTTGTIAGSKGIGVAPRAKWAACRGCAGFFCAQSDLIKCGEFFTCPTRADGSSPDCSKAPNLVSNSWGGGRGNTWFNAVIEAWHVANIIPLFSIGNSGPSCNTANSPGDQNVIGVGSTTILDEISYFSSVGPTSDGRMKPEIAAPGSDVISAYHTGDFAYTSLSGTSMACPHAAGTIALLLTRNNGLTYGQAKDLLEKPADRQLAFSGRTCDGIRDDIFPNHVFGNGRINALKSVQQQTLDMASA